MDEIADCLVRLAKGLIAVPNWLKTFQQQNPYYNDLSLIDSQRRTLIGDKVDEISPKVAIDLIRRKLVEVV